MELLLSKYYHIQLMPPWGDLGYDCQIVASTSKDTISEIDADANIRATFFTPQGIGMATYLSMVTPTTVVHLVHLFKTKDPFEMNSDINVFIPDTIIDHAKCFEYKVGRKVSYGLDLGGYRHFPTITAENEFIKKSTNELITALGKHTESFIADVVSTEYSAYDVLLADSEIRAFQATERELLSFRRAAELQDRINTEQARNDLYEQKASMREEELKYIGYQARYQELTAALAGLQTSLQEENQILNGVRTVMVEMIDRIKAGEITVHDFPDFISIYNHVKEQLANGA